MSMGPQPFLPPLALRDSTALRVGALANFLRVSEWGIGKNEPGDKIISGDSTPVLPVELVHTGQGHEVQIGAGGADVPAAGAGDADAGGGHDVVDVVVVADVGAGGVGVIDPLGGRVHGAAGGFCVTKGDTLDSRVFEVGWIEVVEGDIQYNWM